MLAVKLISEEKTMEEYAERRDINSRIPAIWVIPSVLLVKEDNMVWPSSCTTTRHLMDGETRDKI
jgi:hypothetical protein